SLTVAEISGQYGIGGGHIFVMGPISIPMTILEKGVQLYEQGLSGETALLRSGGDRYRLAGVFYGLSLTFFKKDGKVELLQSSAMGSMVLEKQ
ncbi:MAG: hypothetical protein ACYCPM_13000, partial [Acidobacteriaceae bacterium]